MATCRSFARQESHTLDLALMVPAPSTADNLKSGSKRLWTKSAARKRHSFIDESVVGAGSTEAPDASNIIKPALSRGEL
jgi:ATP-dependent Clp protease ATP-binding subunit ClpA